VRRDGSGRPGQLDRELQNPEPGGGRDRHARRQDRREHGRDRDVATAEPGGKDERNYSNDEPDRDRRGDHRKIRRVGRVDGEDEQAERDTAEERRERVQRQEARDLSCSEHAWKWSASEASEERAGEGPEDGRMQGEEDERQDAHGCVPSRLRLEARRCQHEPRARDYGRASDSATS
jgi:hypothetical protein